jgi:hypothetical protein
MVDLDKLYLTGTSVTDAGLRSLAELTHLSELALDGTASRMRDSRISPD